MSNASVRTSYQLRKASRDQLKGNWGKCILVCLVYSLIIIGINFIPHAGIIISFLIVGPLTLGIVGCFIKLVKFEKFQVENLFDGFKNLGSAIILYVVMSIFIFLWSLLFIIPGLIASLSYSMAMYVLSENPDMPVLEALDESKKMMYGHKWELFCLLISFLGWIILSVVTFGIGFIFVCPYIQAATANFYKDVRSVPILNNQE
ncbi:DUF975 family protein [Clostridium ljungdahlii]|uniref:Integral membrane protein n=1 Tax=Clostridium ljungdahlii TaxID=1538 RepID=A0A168MVY9_9CLOT|nr:DUF975 family protein [Clostridium ljungdahlii]OAA85377.1 hypothetical protein WY13_02547 [Clostridium ljungdahlii]